uniref:Vacuolar protein sorting-associated protein 13 DH-like domain-containing protein n=1 Tax=Octactis speculum TaxID=3111310 RepID=A0A7S2MII4_9STRA|mmetsp:Transcript_62906/g.86461  ORF Transcript_62906/g.86461 Transcript_62906/m.86461 type:complete len:813 (+) Transcript_62906:1-2439(+)
MNNTSTEGQGLKTVQVRAIQIPSAREGEASAFEIFEVNFAELCLMVDLASILNVIGILRSIGDTHSSDSRLAKDSPHGSITEKTTSLRSSFPVDGAQGFKLRTEDFEIVEAGGKRTHFKHVRFGTVLIYLSFARGQVDEKKLKKKNFGLDIMPVLFRLSALNHARLVLKACQWDSIIQSVPVFIQMMSKFYSSQLKWVIFRLAGSMAAIGNPVELVRNVGTGFKAFLVEPASGAKKGVKELGVGVVKGTTSLGKHVSHGALNTVAGLGQTVNTTAEMMTLDPEWNAHREKRRNDFTNKHGTLKEGIKYGTESMVHGLADGLKGVVMTPLEGARKGGVSGFGKGVVKGVVGTVTKPVLGVSEGVVAIVQSASNHVDGNRSFCHQRLQRALPVDPKTTRLQRLTPYCTEAAAAQKVLNHNGMTWTEHAESPQQQWRCYVGHHALSGGPGYTSPSPSKPLWAVFTSHSLVIMNLNTGDKAGDGRKLLASFAWSHMSHCTQFDDTDHLWKGTVWGVEVHLIGENSSTKSWEPLKEHPCAWLGRGSQNSEGKDTHRGEKKECIRNNLGLFCADATSRETLFKMLSAHRHSMGDSKKMNMALEITSNDQFNTTLPGVIPLTRHSPSHRMEKPRLQFKKHSKKLITKDAKDFWERTGGFIYAPGSELETLKDGKGTGEKEANEICWEFIQEWVGNHYRLNVARIALMLLINRTRRRVQVQKPNLIFGSRIEEIYSGKSFDETTRTLEPNGSILVMAWSKQKDMIHRRNSVRFTVLTTSALVGIESKTGGFFEPKAGSSHDVRIMENTGSGPWSKMVVYL